MCGGKSTRLVEIVIELERMLSKGMKKCAHIQLIEVIEEGEERLHVM